jgi:hypothetical protein
MIAFASAVGMHVPELVPVLLLEELAGVPLLDMVPELVVFPPVLELLVLLVPVVA